ncbi:hypothetical protein [uncultured Desulfosarcina sp.]|uniref:RIFT barrel domain-containing protein n=1 Tax=uncultured Desulfosarcina sp. TaxID=218289 RepID=UPI0029C6B5C4|nr:hypothetical protein [uncultured Desulfosarcina sp.]
MTSFADKNIYLKSNNTADISDTSRYVSASVPFARGELRACESLILKSVVGTALQAQFRSLNRWHDGTVKWLLCCAIVDQEQCREGRLLLSERVHLPKAKSKYRVQEDEYAFTFSSETFSCIVDRKRLRPFSSIESNGLSYDSMEIGLWDEQGSLCEAEITDSKIIRQGIFSTEIALNGEFVRDGRMLLKFYAVLEIFPRHAHVRFRLRLHNPRAAVHPGNLWDLGDPGSVLFRRLMLKLGQGGERITLAGLKLDDFILPEFSESVTIYQESSGGENWNSPVHLNRDGRNPVTFRGWRLLADDKMIQTGDRCQPRLWSGCEATGLAVEIEKFWQRFPKAIGVMQKQIELDLLPECFPDLHELQGGEQLTENIRLSFAVDSNRHSLIDMHAWCDPETVIHSMALAPPLGLQHDQRYNRQLHLAFDKDRGFFAKREQLDEYGWRNFGDIYADHETAFHNGPEIFISHYNNQYDLLASFYREFMVTGDFRWRDLAIELAAHVADIDVYQTTEDREEYNLGPFWHTDHYLDAGLSTHRMASKTHLEKKPAYLCGGGPGSEMCYISGLSLHYLLTGDERYRDLVIQLADWSWMSLNGIQTVGEAVLSGIRNFKRWHDGRNRGIVWSRYPFTRGTGNCLNTMLEALELTNTPLYLRRAEALIRGTVHPYDDPSKRNLLDAETAWSYTVFLAAVGRYLLIKESRNELDAAHAYARDSLLLYARWMAKYEYFYLDKPEILEFPNETWVAQDLRKSVILYYAARYMEENERAKLVDRAHDFVDYVTQKLSVSDTAKYTRIQALMLQNGWVMDALREMCPFVIKGDCWKPNSYKPPWLTLKGVIGLFLYALISAVKKSDLKREIKWFYTRLK